MRLKKATNIIILLPTDEIEHLDRAIFPLSLIKEVSNDLIKIYYCISLSLF